MISLILSLLLLLLAFILVNSTPFISRQRPFFDPIRKEKQGTSKINYFRSISASARSPNSDTKEHVFDMPISTNYGSTGRPPGKFHLRHSFKEITDNLEFPAPPFDIFFIEITNNNNYITCYYYNNGDIAAATAADATFNDSYNKEGVLHGTSHLFGDTGTGIIEKSPEWNRNELIHFLYKYRCYLEALPMTTAIITNYNTSTYYDNDANIMHSIHSTDRIIEWFELDKIFSNNNNNNNNNNEYIATDDTSTATTTATNSTTTIDYNTNTNDKDDEDEEKALNNSCRITLTSNDNNNNNNSSNNNNVFNASSYADRTEATATATTTAATTSTTSTTTTIKLNISTYDDNKEANTAHRIHRTDKIKWYDIFNNNNSKSISTSTSTSNTSTTSTTTTINYNTSTYDDNNKANIAHRIHRTDKIKWYNNNKSISTSTTSTTTSTNKDNDETFHLSFIFKLISLFLIITKSFSSNEFKTALKEKHHHQQQQQQHYHGKQRYQSTNSILNNNKSISTSNMNITTWKEW